MRVNLNLHFEKLKSFFYSLISSRIYLEFVMTLSSFPFFF